MRMNVNMSKRENESKIENKSMKKSKSKSMKKSKSKSNKNWKVIVKLSVVKTPCGQLCSTVLVKQVTIRHFLDWKRRKVYKSVSEYSNKVNWWLTGFVTIVGTEVIRIFSSGFEKFTWVRYPNKEKFWYIMRKHEY